MRNLTFFLCLLIGVGCGQKKTADDPADILQSSASADTPISQPVAKPTSMTGLDITYCMGQFSPKDHSDFISIPSRYADQGGRYMRADAFSAFVKMYDAAQQSGIKLVIKSAARNFDYQKAIWERKWTGTTTLSDGTNVATDIKEDVDKARKILEYSSMPGTSRHHWGTDIDLNAFDNAYFEQGEGKKIYDWLIANADSYGYCQPYTPKGTERPHGYNEEKWHWSYQPVSQTITEYARQSLHNEMILGFQGAQTAVEIDVVGKYVLGIHASCMD